MMRRAAGFSDLDAELLVRRQPSFAISVHGQCAPIFPPWFVSFPAFTVVPILCFVHESLPVYCKVRACYLARDFCVTVQVCLRFWRCHTCVQSCHIRPRSSILTKCRGHFLRLDSEHDSGTRGGRSMLSRRFSHVERLFFDVVVRNRPATWST